MGVSRRAISKKLLLREKPYRDLGRPHKLSNASIYSHAGVIAEKKRGAAPSATPASKLAVKVMERVA